MLSSYEVGETSVKGAIAVNFASNILLAGSLNMLWGMINTIQIIAFFPLVNLPMPANSQRLFSIIVKIAMFDIVDITEEIEAFESKLGF